MYQFIPYIMWYKTKFVKIQSNMLSVANNVLSMGKHGYDSRNKTVFPKSVPALVSFCSL